MGKKWELPPDLAAYDQYTNHPKRAEELINHGASVFANAVVALMRAETRAQYDLLARLQKAGLLRLPEEAAGRTLRVYKMRNHGLPIEEDPMDTEEFPGLNDDQATLLHRAVEDSVWYDTEEITGE